jgi:hypothetical protein
MSLLLSKLWGYVVAIGIGALAVIGIYLKGRAAGKEAEQAKQTEKAFEQSKQASTIDADTRALSNAELDKRLRNDQRD